MKSICPASVATLFLLVASFSPGWAATPAAEIPLPAILERGLSAFRVNGGKLAVENWTRGGPLEGTRGEETEIALIQKLEKLYGRYDGHAAIERVALSPASSIYYLEIQLKEGPIYMKFLVFNGRDGERVTALTTHAEPDQILPAYILERRLAFPMPVEVSGSTTISTGSSR